MTPAWSCPHRALVALTVAVGLAAGAVSAQQIRWSRDDDKGNRYEGLLAVQRAKPGIQVLSFTSYQAALEPERSGQLYVAFYLDRAASPVVEAVELNPRLQYRMVSKPWPVQPQSWNRFGPWSTGDVLVKHDLALAQLGILVYLQREPDVRLAPAAVHDGRPVATSTYSLKLKTSWPQRVLNCTVILAGQSPGRIPCDDPKTDVALGQIVTFEIKRSVLPEGDVRVKLEGKDKNREGGPLTEFVFYHTQRPL